MGDLDRGFPLGMYKQSHPTRVRYLDQQTDLFKGFPKTEF